jgi:transglutaminase-like putative cysteine protease
MIFRRRAEPAAPDQPERAAAYGLLASAAVALLPQVPRWPWWLSAGLVLLFGWRFLMLRRGWPAPGGLLRVTLMVLLVALVWRQYGTIFGRDAGSALLALLLALKFLELRRLRDYMIAVFLIYFLILVGFLYSQAPWLVVYLLAVFVATTATLVRLAVPGLRGRRATRLALVLLAQAVPLMLAMHLLFPRLPGALWGLPQDAYAGLTGLSEEMQPGSINELSMSDEVAFRAEFPAARPQPAELYWRALVLTRTDGRRWTRTPEPTVPLRGVADGTALPYTLTLEPSNKPWLPALELPARVPTGALLRSSFVLEAPQPVRSRMLIEMSAHTRRRLPDPTPSERAAALALPAVSTRVAALARELHAGRSDAGTARAALDYFRNQDFYYTLTPPLLGDDPVDEFLFDSRRGFCEHYAAAFVTLMRAAGIPARIVTGYQGGEFNPAGGYYIVRQSDAHAWAELWLAGRGWTRADPTAAIAPERIEYGAAALQRLLARGARPGALPAEAVRQALASGWLESAQRRARLAFDAVQNGWQRWVLGYDLRRQRELLTQLGLGGLTAARLLGVLALIVALVFGAYLIATRPRAPRLDPVSRAYRRFCRRLARVGLARAPHEGELDFATRAAAARPDLAAELGTITRAYLELRYAGRGDAAAFLNRARAFRPRRGLTPPTRRPRAARPARGNSSR